MPSLLQAFVAGRLAVGVMTWASPPHAARLFGLDPETDPVIARLFGARECALGIAAVTSTGETRKRALAMGVAVDAVDAVACALQMRKGALSTQAQILTAGGAVFFAGLGLAALASEIRGGSVTAAAPQT